MKLIGVDVGGTFTDIVCTDTETRDTIIHKAPTTPDDPSHGVITGVSELCERFGLAREDIDHVLHGTTIATNAVLEYNGAVTGMVTSEGYRDILHIGRHQRPQHYSIMQDIPWQDRPLVRRRFRKTVPERLMPPHGDVLARNFVVEELRFLIVYDRCRQRDEQPVIPGCEFYSTKLCATNDGEEARALAGVYVKHHILRLAPPAPEEFRRRPTRRMVSLKYTPARPCHKNATFSAPAAAVVSGIMYFDVLKAK